MAAAAQTGLRIRKLADKSEGQRVRRYDPVTGAGYLADPDTWTIDDTSTWVETPWPFAGISIEGDPPAECILSTSFVAKAASEGWLTLENQRVVHRPGGPVEEPWRVTHTFVQADALIIDTVDGPVRYTVVEQPDKWPAEKNDRDEGFGGDVRWYYQLRLDG